MAKKWRGPFLISQDNHEYHDKVYKLQNYETQKVFPVVINFTRKITLRCMYAASSADKEMTDLV